MKLLLVSAAALTLAACNSLNVTIDVRHARTDAGYINSALAEPGRLYVMDTTPGHQSMLQVAEIPLTASLKSPPVKTYKATNLIGADIEGSVADVAEASAKLEANAFVELSNARVTTYANTFTALSAEINSEVSAGEDVAQNWRLSEAAKAGSNIRYVLVYGVVEADAGRFGYDDSAGVSGSVLFDKNIAPKIGVTLQGTNEQLFEEGPALVRYYVLRAYIDNGTQGVPTYHFARDFSFDTKSLPAMLRLSE